jgi:hypothetical protein
MFFVVAITLLIKLAGAVISPLFERPILMGQRQKI